MSDFAFNCVTPCRALLASAQACLVALGCVTPRITHSRSACRASARIVSLSLIVSVSACQGRCRDVRARWEGARG